MYNYDSDACFNDSHLLMFLQESYMSDLFCKAIQQYSFVISNRTDRYWYGNKFRNEGTTIEEFGDILEYFIGLGASVANSSGLVSELHCLIFFLFHCIFNVQLYIARTD